MNSTATALTEIYCKGLAQLQSEVEAYANETLLWQTKEGISNSGGNLALHLIGNLNHFIGATLGNTGYVRKRDDEFSLKNVPLAEIVNDINTTSKMIEEVLNNLTAEQFEKNYPIEVLKKPMSTNFFLIYLVGHLNYHLGQINYHRRLIEAS
jgi:hypothetical protein